MLDIQWPLRLRRLSMNRTLTRRKREVRSVRRRRSSCALAAQIEQLEPLQLLSAAAALPIGPGPPGPGPPGPIHIRPTPPQPVAGADSPQQIADAYGFNKISIPGNALLGTGQTIAIVEIGIDPNILNDANTFNRQYGLPLLTSSSFLEYNAPGATVDPQTSLADAFETSLDVEWAHAIAPGANILLVNEGSESDLQNANSGVDIDYGANYAANSLGVSVVSISYGGNEYSSETGSDQYFTTPYVHNPVAFVTSSNDSTTAEPGTKYPAVSPEVLAVGGTVFTKPLGTSGGYQTENAWPESGGGISPYEPELVYNAQGQLVQAVSDGTPVSRSTPDVAYNATNFSVYDTWDDSGWDIGHGTSFGAPQWASLVAIADQERALQGLPTLDNLPSRINALATTSPGDFHDITKGSDPYDGENAGPGYDLVTGWGSPRAQDVIHALVFHSPEQPQQPSYANGNPLLYQGGPGPINPQPIHNSSLSVSGPGLIPQVETSLSSPLDNDGLSNAQTIPNATDQFLTPLESRNQSRSWQDMPVQVASVDARSSASLSGPATSLARTGSATDPNNWVNEADNNLWAGFNAALEILGT
jgi:hypothetical protein